MSQRRPIIRRRGGPPPSTDPSPESRPPDTGPMLDLPLGGGDPVQRDVPRDDVPGERPGRRPAPRRDPAPRRSSPWPWLLLLLLLPLAAAAGYFLRPGPPLMTLGSDLLDFGEVRLGEWSSARVTVRNDGESPLELLAVEVADDPDGAFERLEGTCGARALEAAESCELVFAFRPATAQDARASLRLETSAVSGSRSVPLIGRGVAPALELGPARLDFGQATVGERGGAGRARVANRGSASVRVDGFALGGAAAADFIVSDGCAGVELGPGDDCEARLDFVPTAAGERSARLGVRAAAPVAESTELRGRGLPQLPRVALAPDRLDFGSRRVGVDGEPAEVRLRNDGDGPLDVDGVAILSSAGDGERSFAVRDLGCAGSRLEPGADCRLEVSFTPVVDGPLAAVVEITHGAAPGRHRVPVVGTGTAPRAVIEPRQLSFGDVPRGRQSDWLHLEVRNAGSAPLAVSGAALVGADARAFEVSAAGCLRAPIPPGEGCGVEVRFGALRDGPHRAEVRLEHDAAGREPLAAAVNGLGTSARLAVEPGSLDFGEITLGTTRSREVALRNDGRAPLRVAAMGFEGFAPGALSGLSLERSCVGQVLAAGGRCVAAVRATPAEVGAGRGRLTIETDAGPPRAVAVTFDAAPRPAPALSLDTRRLSFTERYVGERSPIEILTLRNTGTARLELREMEISGGVGGPVGDFQLVPGSCADFLPAGTSCTVGVAFQPVAAGERDATLSIRHSAEGATARVALYGLGVAP